VLLLFDKKRVTFCNLFFFHPYKGIEVGYRGKSTVHLDYKRACVKTQERPFLGAINFSSRRLLDLVFALY